MKKIFFLFTLLILDLISYQVNAEMETTPLQPRIESITPLPSKTEVAPISTINIDDRAGRSIINQPGPLTNTSKPKNLNKELKDKNPKTRQNTKKIRVKDTYYGAISKKMHKTPSEPDISNLANQEKTKDLITFGQALNKALKSLHEGRKKESLDQLKSLWKEIEANNEIGVMVTIAYLAMDLEDEETALKAARTAAELAEDDEFYEVLGNVLIKFHHYDEAEDIIKKMTPNAPETRKLINTLTIKKADQAYTEGRYQDAEELLLTHQENLDAGGLELLGWIQYHLGKLNEAASNFSLAYQRDPRLSSAQGLVFSLHRLKRYQDLLEIANSNQGPLDMLIPTEVREAIKAGHRRFTVDAKANLSLASNEGGLSPGMSAKLEPIHRSKKGAPGEGYLARSGANLTLDWHGQHDQVSLTISYVNLDDQVDQVSGQSGHALWQHFGDNGYIYRLGIGRTPSGGVLPSAWTGEIGIGFNTTNWGWGVNGFRRSVESSLLSLTGKRDLKSRIWGRVLETGLGLNAYVQCCQWHTLASTTVSNLSGINVPSNRKVEVYSRALRPISTVKGLSVGPELFYTSYQRNLRAFEYGHGGYFSPSYHFQLGAVANYEFQLKNVEINLFTGLGWSWTRQDAADGNPLTGDQHGKYSATSGNRVVYHASLDGTIPLGRTWRIGFNLGGQKQPDYEDWRASLYAEKLWRP